MLKALKELYLYRTHDMYVFYHNFKLYMHRDNSTFYLFATAYTIIRNHYFSNIQSPVVKKRHTKLCLSFTL